MLNLTLIFEELIKQLGGKIVHDNSIQSFIDDFDAKIVKANYDDEEQFIVTIADFKHMNRKRFSMAHELGHLFLHMNFLKKDYWCNNLDAVGSERYRYGHSMEEKEADEFAAAFLMPKNQFKCIAKENDYNIEKIAKIFGVSRQAATIRANNLKLI
ncbi:ImmA/IrrE family metallo-endopeptidase [Clostridium fermenticellae]|uniref:ImmA/IrrE family metallo-endopeptidase n=1 Tax=Clostridium fermenticellae TaxID=2068654 RepID=A0A386H1M5_9CLOT|nr:ImmA/IrrE family metallo-endopeptidase [Clostridium fermenticellae]